MAEKKDVKLVLKELEEGIKNLFESDRYKQFLTTMSKFTRYSVNNCMMIASQRPDATLVAGYKAWQTKHHRHVKKDEEGIKILAPCPKKIKVEIEKEINGVKKKVEEERTIPYYRLVSVFDVSQTEGRELPTIGVDELTGKVEGYERFRKALEENSPVPIRYADIQTEAKGFYDLEKKEIVLRKGMDEVQELKTLIHEISHATLHDKDREKEEGEKPKSRNQKEVEAESIAYTVCSHYGIDTSEYSFGYIAGWSKDKELEELKDSLDTIRKTADDLIGRMDKTMEREIMQEMTPKERVIFLMQQNGQSDVLESQIDLATSLYEKGYALDAVFYRGQEISLIANTYTEQEIKSIRQELEGDYLAFDTGDKKEKKAGQKESIIKKLKSNQNQSITPKKKMEMAI